MNPLEPPPLDHDSFATSPSVDPPILPAEEPMTVTSNDDDDDSEPSTATKRKSTSSKSTGKVKSVAWDHFTKNIAIGKAKCNYCGQEYACGGKKHGTSNLLNHLNFLCTKYANRTDKKQKTLAFQPAQSGVEGQALVGHTFNQEACRLALAEMICIDELPFSIVEHRGFRRFCLVMQPRFKIPGRITVARDCQKVYLNEYSKLKVVLTNPSQRVSLTTDTWTSCQNLAYMCLTAHYIDDDWILRKKIINFCLVPDHKGVTLGKTVEACLLSWGIERVFSLTVDNASSNDNAVSYLSTRVNNWGCSVLNAQHMHVRCSAHILNLVVTEGLKEYDESISRIRNVVKFVRSSPARLQKFKSCVEMEKIQCSRLVCLDVATRWNSTYLMLEAAEKFEKAFERLATNDSAYIREFSTDRTDPRKKAPEKGDWARARVFVEFLKVFYEATLKFSGSFYVTSNMLVDQLVKIYNILQAWKKSKDVLMRNMATSMQRKYNKYWGDMTAINPMFFVAILLDPRRKERYVKFCLDELYPSDGLDKEADKVAIANILRGIRLKLEDMYDEYVELEHHSVSNATPHSQTSHDMDVDSCITDDHLDRFVRQIEEEDSIENKTEVSNYLTAPLEDVKNATFNLLEWWKNNSTKYKVLHKIARDVLAIPISTVASEFAFSTGGRVLDVYRSSLSPKTVEGLICAQNWIEDQPIIDIQELQEGIEKLEIANGMTPEFVATCDELFANVVPDVNVVE